MENDKDCEVLRVLSCRHHFQVFNIPFSSRNGSGISLDELNRKYRALALNIHPDKTHHPLATQAFTRLKEALDHMTNLLEKNERSEQTRIRSTYPSGEDHGERARESSEPASHTKLPKASNKKFEESDTEEEEEQDYRLRRARKRWKQQQSQEAVADRMRCTEEVLVEGLDDRTHSWRIFNQSPMRSGSKVNEPSSEPINLVVPPDDSASTTPRTTTPPTTTSSSSSLASSSSASSLSTGAMSSVVTMCVLCRRGFPSGEALHKHVQCSKLHAENILRLQKSHK